jgi:hypothetical protein
MKKHAEESDVVKFRLGLTMKAQFETIAKLEQRTLASLLRFALWEWLETKESKKQKECAQIGKMQHNK